MSKVIGIDLGTTNSVVAVYEGGSARIIPNVTGQLTTPSVVAYTDRGEWLIGPAARNQQVVNPANTIYSIKRFMGRRHDEVRREERIVPYEIVGKPDEFVELRLGRRRFTPQEISALLLRELKETAEAHLGEAVDRAVITVPAYFNDSQRQATKDAGAIAGLKVERIINEPTAAALAYGHEARTSSRIAVVDFGGGTLDLSVLEIGNGTFKVIGVHGNTHLGGDDFDQRIIDVVADDFRRKERVDLREDAMALQRLKEAAECAKRELATRAETHIQLPFICVDGQGPRHLQHVLERDMFEALCADLFDELACGCRRTLAEAGLLAKDIDDVVLVGGSTRLPKVQSIAREVFDTEELDRSINPDEVVALGAAILGGVIQGDLKNVLLMDVTTHGLGVETAGGGAATVLAKNSPIPASVSRVFSTPMHNQTSVPIRVLEGEADTVEDNRTLGLFHLRGIPKVPAGVPQIEVSFGVDADGILTVAAKDKATGRDKQIVIDDGIGLDRAELERMRREVEQHSRHREDQKGATTMRNHAESVYGDVEKWLEFNGRMLPPRARSALEAALKRLCKRIDRNDVEGMKASLRKLDELMSVNRKAS